MGTLSENQTQEHNKEENRSGREDLGAGATSKEKAREWLRGPSESGRDFGPVCGGSKRPGLRATGPAGQEPEACGLATAHREPAGRSCC